MMLKKRKARELAMQVLFTWDMQGQADAALAQQVVAGAAVEEATRLAALRIATSVWEQRQTIDAWIERLAPQWPPRRQPGVDRNLIRLGVWELTCADTPPKVVIDEAIELAKEFSTEQSAAFVNGVLDAVLREHKSPPTPAAESATDSTPAPAPDSVPQPPPDSVPPPPREDQP
jgi:N utilization substance protein B